MALTPIKFSALSAASVPWAGTERFPVVQDQGGGDDNYIATLAQLHRLQAYTAAGLASFSAATAGAGRVIYVSDGAADGGSALYISDGATWIDFSNDLTGFRSGTGTPTFTFASAGDLSVDHHTQSLSWIKFGSLFFAWELLLDFTPTFTSSTGQALVDLGTLPGGGGFTRATGSLMFDVAQNAPSFPASTSQLGVEGIGSANDLGLVAMGSGAVDVVEAAEFTTATRYLLRSQGMGILN